MSVLQSEDLVSYQLRTAYLNEIADGVGERLITLNESIVNSAPFKAAGWRSTPGLIKRTHSPPIPTAVASEYFRAPRSLGITLEDEPDEGGGLLGGGGGGMGGTVGGGSVISGTEGGGDTLRPATAATKRRRRREQLEEDEDSSDLSDESDDDGSTDQRAAQQIKFAKMPIRHRSGSSPLQSSNLRNPPIGPSASPSRPVPPRRGSQSALEAVKERARRDTVTSSEVSSENEFDASGFHRQREREREREAASSRAHARAKAASSRLQSTSSSNSSSVNINKGEIAPTIKRQESDLLEEEREDDEDEASDDESDASDLSSTFAGSIDSASILHAVGDNPLNAPPPPDDGPIVGTPPREFTRTSTIRRSHHPASLQPLGDLPPPRPVSAIRPVSIAPPRSLLTAALKAKDKSANMPFDRFASLSGQGEPNPIMVRIYAPFSAEASKPFEVAIRPSVHDDQRNTERAVTVAELIGLSLWRYVEEKREPPLPANRLNVNWWMLRMMEGDEVDEDFPPLERKRPLASFTTANNNKGTRFRSNSKVYDDFALVEASEEEFAENQIATPQFSEENLAETDDGDGGAALDDDGERTPRNMTPQPGATSSASQAQAQVQARASPQRAPQPQSNFYHLRDNQLAPLDQPRLNPILTTTYRHNAPHADAPAPAAAPNTQRGRKKLLRVHIHSVDAAPGQMVTVDVTTDTYLEEVLDIVCKKRQLDKGSHVLKLPGSGAVVLTDREVSSIGNVTDLDLYRKRFASEGTGASPGGSIGASPKLFADGGSSMAGSGGSGLTGSAAASRRFRRAAGTTPGSHPLARATSTAALPADEVSDASFKKYTVWRRQGLKLMGTSERLLTIDGEYVHIIHASSVAGGGGGGAAAAAAAPKNRTYHFSNVVGCKVSLRHPTHFKLIVYKATEPKRYDFEAKTADEAQEIVAELKKAMSPYRDI